jgi:riboflavin kinase/FMN adenylyltransferase
LVMLFEPQPGEYFHGQQAPVRLSSFREKLEVLRQFGVDYVCCLKFDDYLASMPAIEFAKRIIFTLIQAKYILIGEDFRFGHGRAGDVALLNEIGEQTACTVQHFPDFFIDKQRVSSTKIRWALQLGELDYAAMFLGRPYSMCGRVVHGDGRGRQWGFPTANVSLHRTTLPLNGVFCVRVLRLGKPALTGVANIGCRPTVDGSKHVLEIHLFDVDESLYGEMLQVCFLHKLRDEIKFTSVDALVAQIHNDVAAARNWSRS